LTGEFAKQPSLRATSGSACVDSEFGHQPQRCCCSFVVPEIYEAPAPLAEGNYLSTVVLGCVLWDATAYRSPQNCHFLTSFEYFSKIPTCHVVVLLSGPSVQMLYLGPPLIWPSEAEYLSPQRPVVYNKTVYTSFCLRTFYRSTRVSAAAGQFETF